ncbi:hypothetical protein T492DRAFT_1065424 [Pavlovales sp. CCMP2436]|nr:hypothetical protein T492DRAFT_1065424 [Pavlovales sp. CCMP2436]|mmetsp:Transcript_12199/g.30704  ORF Transcript_12199/g.30704 Transcript_12199/m.30704 type:complete len:173 (-) Transcript_12199:250-768(-)
MDGSGDAERAALQAKLTQQAELISALLQTQELLAAQAREQQTVLRSLAKAIDFNVQHAATTAKRKHNSGGGAESSFGGGSFSSGAPMLVEQAAWRSVSTLPSAEDLGAFVVDEAINEGGNDCHDLPPPSLPPADRFALLEALASALGAIVQANAHERVRELERLLDMSLALL